MFEVFVSSICLRMNKTSDEIESKKMSTIMKTYAYIKKEDQLKKEEEEKARMKRF